MSKEDDGSILLWVGLGLAAWYFLSKKFSPAGPPAITPPVGPLALPASSSATATAAAQSVSSQPTPDLTAAATNASAPDFASDTDFGIASEAEW